MVQALVLDVYISSSKWRHCCCATYVLCYCYVLGGYGNAAIVWSRQRNQLCSLLFVQGKGIIYAVSSWKCYSLVILFPCFIVQPFLSVKRSMMWCCVCRDWRIWCCYYLEWIETCSKWNDRFVCWIYNCPNSEYYLDVCILFLLWM